MNQQNCNLMQSAVGKLNHSIKSNPKLDPQQILLECIK